MQSIKQFKRRICIALMLLCGMLLCGCTQNLWVHTTLAEQESLAILVPMEKPMDYRDDIGSLAAYCEDGFYSAKHYASSFSISSITEDEMGMQLVRFQTPNGIAQCYGEIRLAVTDAELTEQEILAVSPTFSLVVEGRNAFWDAMIYDRTTNEITGTHQSVLDETPKQRLQKWTFWTAVCGILMAGFCAGLFAYPRAWRKVNPVLWLLSAIPAGGMGYWLYLWDFNRYYAWDKTINDVITDATVLIVWGIISCAMWVVWAAKREEEKAR